MSQISLKSISGITSITTPAGADNQFTIHTNNTSEVIKLDHVGNIHINNHVNATGISSAASIDVGSNIKLGNAGIITATGISGGTFSGSTATFSGDVSITDKIVHTDDTNTAIRFPAADTVSIETAGSTRLHIHSDGRFRVGTTAQPSGTVGGFQLDMGSYPGTLRLMSGAGASGTQSASINIGGSNHNASLTHGNNYGAQLSLFNYNTTDGNSTAVSFHNSNGLASSRILGNNASHSSRTGQLVFMTSSGTHPTEKLRIGSAGQIGIAGANYGSSGQVLTSQGSGSAVQWATPSSITTAGGTMTLGFQDHVAGAVSSTTPTAYYQRIGNMVFCSCDTGAINLSGLNNGQILLVTGCFPVTRDNNWTMAGSAYQYTVNSGQNSGGPVIVPTMGYWLSNTSLYFVIPRNNSTADNMTVGMCNSNNTRIFMQWHYKVN